VIPIKGGEGPTGATPETPAATKEISATITKPDRSYRTPLGKAATQPPLAPSVDFPHCGTDAVSVQVTWVENTPLDAGGPMLESRPTRTELLSEVHMLVQAVVQSARTEHGTLPGVGIAEWWAAPPIARIAGLLILAEAWLVADPDRVAREQLKSMSADLSRSRNWAKAARLPSHRELQRRRYPPDGDQDRWTREGGQR
jgi:hypothetical protein